MTCLDLARHTFAAPGEIEKWALLCLNHDEKCEECKEWSLFEECEKNVKNSYMRCTRWIWIMRLFSSLSGFWRTKNVRNGWGMWRMIVICGMPKECQEFIHALHPFETAGTNSKIQNGVRMQNHACSLLFSLSTNPAPAGCLCPRWRSGKENMIPYTLGQ